MPDANDQRRRSLDSEAFTLVLSAIFTCVLTSVVVSIDATQARPAVVAAARSQQGCPS